MTDAAWAVPELPACAPDLLEELADIDVHRLTTTVDKESVFFAGTFGSIHWSRRFEWPWTLAHAAIRPRDVVLDAGGGDAAFQFALARRCDHVVNLEASWAMADRSELLARRRGVVNILARIGDIAALPYVDGHFDKVFCISVIEHCKDPTACATELYRVTRPGGRLLLTMDVAGSVGGGYSLDLGGARRLLSRFEIDVPDPPSNAMWRRDGDRVLAVFCTCVEKPGTP